MERLLARVNLDGMLRKAQSLGAGERWIAVHTNGPDAKGTLILIKMQTDGWAQAPGGVGGKLNHPQLHGSKSEAD